MIDRDPALVRVVLNYLRSGTPMHLFTTLPKSAAARDMLDELDFFCVDFPEVRDIDDKTFKEELKDVKDETSKVFGANRFGARNAAAEFAIGLEIGRFNAGVHKTK